MPAGCRLVAVMLSSKCFVEVAFDAAYPECPGAKAMLLNAVMGRSEGLKLDASLAAISDEVGACL